MSHEWKVGDYFIAADTEYWRNYLKRYDIGPKIRHRVTRITGLKGMQFIYFNSLGHNCSPEDIIPVSEEWGAAVELYHTINSVVNELKGGRKDGDEKYSNAA